MREVGNILAMPIPFAYYHLMNIILVLNFLLLVIIPALFIQSYTTVVPLALALIVYMGLREVSAATSDPFGRDAVDLPVHQILDHTFDQSITLLEAFSSKRSHERTR